MTDTGETARIEAGKFLARCRECGGWQEVRPQAHRTEEFFEVWEAEFSCCGQDQRAVFTVEKDYIDFH